MTIFIPLKKQLSFYQPSKGYRFLHRSLNMTKNCFHRRSTPPCSITRSGEDANSFRKAVPWVKPRKLCAMRRCKICKWSGSLNSLFRPKPDTAEPFFVRTVAPPVSERMGFVYEEVTPEIHHYSVQYGEGGHKRINQNAHKANLFSRAALSFFRFQLERCFTIHFLGRGGKSKSVVSGRPALYL